MATRRHFIHSASVLSAATLAAGLPPIAEAAGKITVAYAGSMGVVMDHGIGPAFTAKTGTAFQGIGQASLALAHLIAAKSLTPDVFVSVSKAPIEIVKTASLTSAAMPVASTEMVLAYAPKSSYAAAFASAKPWYETLQSSSLRFGRTDPATDPQGQYALYTLQLAEAYYHQPGLAARIAGGKQQIFAEPSLLARLQDGELDATIGYESAVISQHLPYVKLPPEINMSSPAHAQDYAKASLILKGKTAHPSPLVFYAAALKNAANPAAAAAFIAFLTSPAGQAIFARYGYLPGQGAAL